MEMEKTLFDFLWIAAIPLGLILGSFLNVVIYRLNTGMGIGGRSRCFSCGRTLTALDLVPVFSFVFLRGKCRTCKTPISWQYPLVELMSGVLFALVTFFFPPLDLMGSIIWLMQIVTACLMIVIFVYDIRHKIIPNSCVYALILISLIGLFVGGVDGAQGFDSFFHSVNLDRLIAGPLLSIPMVLLWFFSRGRAIGFGDAKLALFMGWSLGLAAGISSIILGIWIGAIVSVAGIAYLKLVKLLRGESAAGGLAMNSEVPFAPYLIIGFYIALFTAADIFQVDLWFK